MENTELTHHGTKGMKWGVRRYQTKDGSLTAAGKKRYSDGSSGSKKKRGSFLARKIAAKNAKPSSKNKKVEKPEVEDVEAKKQRILKSRSAKLLYENADLFSNKELTDAYNRLNTEANIKRLIPEQVNKGKKFVTDVTDLAQTTNNLINQSVNLYDNYNKVKKIFDTINGATDDKK